MPEQYSMCVSVITLVIIGWLVGCLNCIALLMSNAGRWPFLLYNSPLILRITPVCLSSQAGKDAKTPQKWRGGQQSVDYELYANLICI